MGCRSILENGDFACVCACGNVLGYVNVGPDALILSLCDRERLYQLDGNHNVRIELVVVRPITPPADSIPLTIPRSLEANRYLPLVALVVTEETQTLDLQIPDVEQLNIASNPAENTIATGRSG